MLDPRLLYEGGVPIDVLKALIARIPQGVLLILSDRRLVLNRAAIEALEVDPSASRQAHLPPYIVASIENAIFSGSRALVSANVSVQATLVDGTRIVVCEDHRTQEVERAALLVALGSIVSQTLSCAANSVLQVLSERVPVDTIVLSAFKANTLSPLVWHGVMLDPVNAALPAEHPTAALVRAGGVCMGEFDLALPMMTSQRVVVPLVGPKFSGALFVGLVEDADHRWLDVGLWEDVASSVVQALTNAEVFERLVSEEANLRSLIDHLSEGVLLFDERGEVLQSNVSAQHIMELVPQNLNEDFRPYRILDLNHRVMRRTEWPFFKAARTQHTVLGEEVILDFGGRLKFLSIDVIPMRAPDGRIRYLGTLRDITEQVHSNRKRAEFLSVAGHELRGPLTPLLGFVQLLIQQSESGEPADLGMLQRTERQILRLARLVDDLLDVGRLEAGQMPVELVDVDVRQVSMDLAASSDWGPMVRVVADQPVWVRVDAARFEQVLLNLIQNALRHSHSTSPVVVELHRVDQSVLVRVLDDGVGIPAEHLPHIFERFYRGTRATHGTGLGLFVARKIVELHGGRISISNRPEGGVLVEVELPGLTH